MRTYWRGFPEQGAAEPADTAETSSWRFNASREGCMHKLIFALSSASLVPRPIRKIGLGTRLFIAVPTLARRRARSERELETETSPEQSHDFGMAMYIMVTRLGT